MQDPMNEMGENASEPPSLVRNSVELSTRTTRFQSDVRSDIPYHDNRSNRWSLYSGDVHNLYQDRSRRRLCV